MTTAWYYDFYEPGAFPNQEKLCKAVEWTKCNLEMQLASSTVLTSSPGNPMTIRLLAVRKALNQLEDYVKPMDTAIKTTVDKLMREDKTLSMGGTFHGKDSSIETGGAPIETIEISRISGEKQLSIEFEYNRIHLPLYEFFTNFGSALDRLVYEINRLYVITAGLIDWSRLTNTEKYKHWDTLNTKNDGLAEHIRNSAAKFSKAIRYRNRLIHDGLIKFEADISIEGIYIRLPEKPDDDKSNITIDALDFCLQAKADLLATLDVSYKLMIKHYENHGNPPW